MMLGGSGHLPLSTSFRYDRSTPVCLAKATLEVAFMIGADDLAVLASMTSGNRDAPPPHIASLMRATSTAPVGKIG